MAWKKFFKYFFISTALTIGVASMALGVFGYVLAGPEGFRNGLQWGLILGIASVPFTTFAIFAKFWGDVAGMYGRARFKDESEGQEDDWRMK